MKNTRLTAALLALALLNTVLVIIWVIGSASPPNAVPPEAKNTPAYSRMGKYTLYVGLNDKDADTQLISTEEAEKLLHTIAIKHADGFTMFHGKGYWRNEDNVADHEESLVFVFYDIAEPQIDSILAEMLVALNQRSILVEKGEACARFHSY